MKTNYTDNENEELKKIAPHLNKHILQHIARIIMVNNNSANVAVKAFLVFFYDKIESIRARTFNSEFFEKFFVAVFFHKVLVRCIEIRFC